MSPQNYVIPSTESEFSELDLDDLIAVYPLGDENLRIFAFSIRTILSRVSGISQSQLSESVRALLAQGVIIWSVNTVVEENRVVADGGKLYLSTARDDGTGDAPSAGNANFQTLSGDTTALQMAIDDLVRRTTDLRVVSEQVWVPPTGMEGVAITPDDFTQQQINAASWAATVNSGRASTYNIYVRLPENANPSDYRVSAGGFFFSVSALVKSRSLTLSGYDLYSFAIRIEANQPVTLEYHGTESHTEYRGILDPDQIDERVRRALLGFGRVRDARNGFPETLTEDDVNDLFISSNGKLYEVKKTRTPDTPAQGQWGDYSNANYLGVVGSRGRTGSDGQFYYNLIDHHFYQFIYDAINVRTDAHIVFRTSDVLGNDSRWLGEQSSESDALHAVPEPFNSGLTYIALFGGRIQQLINLSYVAAAPGDPPFTYTPILVGEATREQLLALSTNVSEIDTRLTELEEAGTGGQGLSPQDVQLLDLVKRKIADIILESAPTWLASDQTKAQIASLTIEGTAAGQLTSG